MQATRRDFIGALGIYAAGGLFWAFLPHFVGLQVTTGGMSEAQAGSLGAIYLAGFSVISLIANWWVGRVNWRLFGAAAALLAVFCLWLMQAVGSYAASTLPVFVIGLCMGSFWVLAYRVFGAMKDPDRSFAVGILVSYSALAAVSWVVGGMVAPRFGLTGAAALLSGVIIVFAASSLLLPRGADEQAADAVPLIHKPPLPVAFALLGLTVTGLAFASVWAFAERIGATADFDKSLISTVIAGNLLATALGSAGATLLGARLGRRITLLVGMVLFAGCILLLVRAEVFWLYAVSVSGLGFFVGFILPYQMGAIGAVDTEGRFVVLIAAAQGVGSALGAYAGGVAFGIGGPYLLALAAAAAVIVSLVLFLPVIGADSTRR